MEQGWSTNFAMVMLVYVDDYLLSITHDQHAQLALRAGEVMDRILEEMGIENALHKAVGPVNVIVWLGLLIDCRPGRTPCVRLPESKRIAYLAQVMMFVDEFRGKTQVPALRMAQILGRLNFASKGYPGGHFFMSRMWDRFRGVTVD